MTVRAANVEDAAGIAAVHVESWRWSYKGLLPQKELDALDVEARTRSWRTQLAAVGSEPRRTLVATDEVGICVFAAVGPCRDHDARGEGELYAIYLALRAAGRGIGHALLEEAHAALRTLGFREVTLWVLRNNARAIAFYVREGYAPDGESKVEDDRCGGEPQLRYRRAL